MKYKKKNSHGQLITEVNVWDRVLIEKEISQNLKNVVLVKAISYSGIKALNSSKRARKCTSSLRSVKPQVQYRSWFKTS